MMLRTRIFYALAWALILSFGTPVAAATVIRDPEAFVGSVYARLAKGGDYIPPDDIYSPHLNTLWAGEAHDAGKEVGRIDFLFWINGQDGVPTAVKIKTVPVEGRTDRRIEVVKFVNDKPQTLQFYFERIGGVWKLDDVVSLSPGEAWTLSVILKYGWAD
jgi:hypothetical protein